MRKNVETFHANKGCKLAIGNYTNFAVFKIEICGSTIFTCYFLENLALHTTAPSPSLPPTLFFKSLQHWVPYDMRQKATFLVLEV